MNTYFYDENNWYTRAISSSFAELSPPVDFLNESPTHDNPWPKWNATTQQWEILTYPPIVREKKITKFAMRERFTLAEKVAIYNSTDVMVKIFLDDLQTTTYVDLNSQKTIDALNYLNSINIITIERLDEILNGPIADEDYFI